MADLSMKSDYQLRLTDKEFRLVGLGLIGGLEKPEDITEARALNTRIMEGRASFLRQALKVAEGAVERAEGLQSLKGKSTPALMESDTLSFPGVMP